MNIGNFNVIYILSVLFNTQVYFYEYLKKLNFHILEKKKFNAGEKWYLNIKGGNSRNV